MGELYASPPAPVVVHVETAADDRRSLSSADEKHGITIHSAATGTSGDGDEVSTVAHLPTVPRPAHVRETRAAVPGAEKTEANGTREPEPAPDENGDEEDDTVISLKKCHHSFHSRCLTSWFLTNRYDCPICRTVFWGNGRQYDAREREQNAAGSRGPGAMMRDEDPERVFWEAMIF